jgi:malate/lactate dehydrogenase
MVRIVEYALDDDEKQMLDKSAAAVRETHDALKKLVAL